MGDRANLYVRRGTEGVYIYAHWMGADIFHAAKRALAKLWRWTDEAYLTRIIYDEIVGKHAGTEHSFGIWTSRPDNEHPILRINVDTQTVFFESEEGQSISPTWTFYEFVNLSDDTLDAFEAEAHKESKRRLTDEKTEHGGKCFACGLTSVVDRLCTECGAMSQ